MPARRAFGRAVASAAVGLLVAGGAAACDTAVTHHLRGRSAVVNALAVTLDRYQYAAYRADYALGDGTVGVAAHAAQPQRSEYLFDSGRYVTAFPAAPNPDLRPVTVTACTTRSDPTACTLTDADPDVHAQPDLAAVRRASGGRFLATAEAISLVTTAANDGAATLTTRYTTIAGQRAHCVTVSYHGATRFDTCITTRGVLASFRGRADGRAVDVTLTAFRRTGLGVSFAAPVGARITDHRAKTD